MRDKIKVTMMSSRFKRRGFALPTVLIASVAMMIVLLAALTSVSSISSSIKNQYYEKLARLTSESGANMATACIEKDNDVSWTDDTPLRPGTSCSGSGTAGYILNGSNVRTSFSVGLPTLDDGVRYVTVSSKVELLRTSNGLAWKTYTNTSKTRVGALTGFDAIKFGYSITYDDVYFFTLGRDGTVKATGGNSQGELGIGSTANSPTSTVVTLPNDVRVKDIYTSFLSVGHQTFVLGDDNNIYGSGANNHGQLGTGNTAATTSYTKVNLPAGKLGRYANPSGVTNFFTTTDGNVYSAGLCEAGFLGSNYTISGCSSTSTPVRVNLPTPSSLDQNTLPSDAIISDFRTAFIQMKGGRIYGWGGNPLGQLGDGTRTDRSNPIKIGTYGDSSQPTPISVAFNGENLFVADSDYKVKSTGWNKYGQVGRGPQRIVITGPNKCLQARSTASSAQAEIYTCGSGNPTLQYWIIDGNGQIKNSETGMCLNIQGNSTANGANIIQYPCGTPLYSNSIWQMRMDGSIYNPASGKCMDNTGNTNANGNDIQLYTCVANAGGQLWNLEDALTLVDYTLPEGVTGQIIKVVSDQRFSSILLDTDNDGSGDDVYSVGPNENGQLGNGTSGYFQVTPTRFLLPSGVKAIDVYNTASGGTGSTTQNTFVVGSDGKVYGAGINEYGQLGDGTTTDRSTPVAMNIINGTSIRAKQVISGYGTTVVLTTRGDIYTVGRNHDGQLGDGTTTNRSTPSQTEYTRIVSPITF